MHACTCVQQCCRLRFEVLPDCSVLRWGTGPGFHQAPNAAHACCMGTNNPQSCLRRKLCPCCCNIPGGISCNHTSMHDEPPDIGALAQPDLAEAGAAADMLLLLLLLLSLRCSRRRELIKGAR